MRMRQIHRLLGVVLCVPTLLWGLSGALLAWKNWAPDPVPPPPLRPPPIERPFRIDVTQALSALGQDAQPQSVSWEHLAGAPYYLIRPATGAPLLVNGETGQRLAGVDAEQAAAIAAAEAPDTIVVGSELQTVPSLVYLSGMELPVHRVALADGGSVFVSPRTGRVYFRADRLTWLIRFAFYGLHVWKWSSTPGQAHSYLFLLALALALVAGSLSGLVLLFRPARKRQPERFIPLVRG